MMCCASCGIAENDDIKLKTCTACKLVRYCSVACQRNHRPQHKRECKKRAAEIRDEILFKQPESTNFGDCPICLLPLSWDKNKCLMLGCCSKLICLGCAHLYAIREDEERLERKCPFCRQLRATSQKEANANEMRRMEVNDPVAIRQLGTQRYHEGDYVTACEYWTKAAGLGDAEAHYELSIMYFKGKGVEKDEKKEVYHVEKAAIGGHPGARHNLGFIEWKNGRKERAVKHWIIAANLGFDESIEALKKVYKVGNVSKEDFAAALRAHQAAVDETKSAQREAAEQNRTWIIGYSRWINGPGQSR